MNPYEVLGVSEDADEETVKKAYRALVKKYHPDRYVNNPLADLASEKIKEINRAYDMIMNKTSDGQDSTYSRQGTYSRHGGAAGTQATFQNVRVLISQSRIPEAMAMLEVLPKTAEWYYLSGRARMQIGWYDQAITFLRTAVNMDPNNIEYRNALDNVLNRNAAYRSTPTGMTSSGCCSPCNLCTACMCMDCICPCY